MRTFRIRYNGQDYFMDVEELVSADGQSQPVVSHMPPAPGMYAAPAVGGQPVVAQPQPMGQVAPVPVSVPVPPVSVSPAPVAPAQVPPAAVEEGQKSAPAAAVDSPAASSGALPSEGTGEGEEVVAPMPGNVLRLLKKVGETAREDEPVLIFEAMKMENEIVAPKTGVVTGYGVKEGDMIDAGAVLFTIA